MVAQIPRFRTEQEMRVFCDRGSAPFFKPEFDRERVERVRRFVLDAFSAKDYVLFEDAVSEGGEARDVMHRAFTGLVDAGGYRMRYCGGRGDGGGVIGALFIIG